MTEIEASKILRNKAIAWGAADKHYQPAHWMIDALIAAVKDEREECAKLCDAHDASQDAFMIGQDIRDRNN